MERKRRLRLVILGLTLPMAALTLALSVRLVLRSRWTPPAPPGSTAETTLSTTGRGSPPAGDTLTPLGESLLADSILSIVQNYYVDADRVSNDGLIDTVLGALTVNPRVKAGRDSGGIWVSVDGRRTDFPLKSQPVYQDVLDTFTGIARLVSQAGIELAGTEGVDKSMSPEVGLLNGMLGELDAHSALLSQDAYRELRQGTEGSFGGLGVLVGIRNNLLTVIKPLPRSPAQRAGIRKHDRILGIDGLFTYGYTLDQLVEFMRGDPGTEVNLSLLRAGARAPSQMVLKREIIHVDSVAVEEVAHPQLKVLKLTVENFASRTSREILGAIKRYRAKNGGVMNGLVLDLRANPGGLLDQAVQVADLFLQNGVIVTTRGRREEVESAGTGFDEIGFPMAVLIDSDSASASEIVAGALQDHARAVVIGQPSFGKGSVQTIFELPGERALKLTIARYYTPAGRSIQNVGIIPDIWMQPVLRRPTNENLLGSYRYKNERFLRNHLKVRNDDSTVNPEINTPALKTYYLSDRSEEDDERPAGFDPELDAAMAMFGRIRSAYGDRLPPAMARSSHWLGLAGPELMGLAAKLEADTSGYLFEKLGIAWKNGGGMQLRPPLRLVVGNATAPELEVGETLRLPWKITNEGSTPVARVSIFVRSEVTGLETREVLVGDVPAHGTVQGELKVEVPGWFEAGPVELRVGAAAEAWPVADATVDYQVRVKTRPMARIEAQAELVEESLGGGVPGVLEGKESGVLRVTVANLGDAPAANLKVSLVNLSGRQVEVTEKPVDVRDLAPGATIDLKVPVRAGEAIYTTELGFGLHVESRDLRSPHRQRLVVRGLPNQGLSARQGIPETISH